MLFPIIVGFILIGVTVVIQGHGTLYWIKRFDHYNKHFSKKSFRKRSLRLIISTAFFLMEETAVANLCSVHPSVGAALIREDGTLATYGALSGETSP